LHTFTGVPSNAPSPIFVLWGIVNAPVNLRQPMNASSPILVTLAGIDNVPVNLLRPLNARSSIFVNQAESLMDESSPAL
jgi:hypothetical protein